MPPKAAAAPALPQTLADIPAYQAALDNLQALRAKLADAQGKRNALPSYNANLEARAQAIAAGQPDPGPLTGADAKQIATADETIATLQRAVELGQAGVEQARKQAIGDLAAAWRPRHQQAIQSVIDNLVSLQASIANLEDVKRAIGSATGAGYGGLPDIGVEGSFRARIPGVLETISSATRAYLAS